MKMEIKVPSMGESITEVTIGAILVPSGSIVKTDTELLELETDKVNQVLYSPQAGKVLLNVQTGDSVKIGQVIGIVDSEGVTNSSEEKIEEKPQLIEEKEEKTKEPTEERSQETAQVRYTKNLFLAELNQPKRESFIERSQVNLPEKTVSNENENTRETRRKMSTIRRVIGQRLVEAQHTTAMLTTFNEVDLTQMMQIREKHKELFTKTYQVKLGWMSFFVKAVVMALKTFPNLNSYIDGEEIVHREYYDIGIAVATDKGLIVPVIRQCDQLAFFEIELAIESFAKKAKEGKLTVEELQGGGFTITNGGVYGSLLSTPILNPPQSGILGMHKIEKRPVVVDDEIVIRSMMYLALSYDHRLVDGKEAVSFLVLIKQLLEDPTRLLLGL
jgi:2-oxoglutarate dehydrogenase E2 component (dihydrolipoamide succinyltransferase)